jgi:hypothetical protein
MRGGLALVLVLDLEAVFVITLINIRKFRNFGIDKHFVPAKILPLCIKLHGDFDRRQTYCSFTQYSADCVRVRFIKRSHASIFSQAGADR